MTFKTTFVAFFLILANVVFGLRINNLKVPSTVYSESDVDLTCDFDLQSDPLYGVKWYHNDNEFFRYMNNDRHQTFTLPGITVDPLKSSEYKVRLQNVSKATTGAFTCEVSTDAPMFTTVRTKKFMKVVDKGTPILFDEPINQTVLSGNIASFVCKASGTELEFEWKRNYSTITTRFRRYNIISIKNGSLLRIEPVVQRDSNTFNCFVKNKNGTAASKKATLKVISQSETPEGFPVVKNHLKYTVVHRGRNVSLTCGSRGYENMTVVWMKNSAPIELSNKRYSIISESKEEKPSLDSSVSVSTNFSLKITNAEENDQGYYECVIRNKLGTVFSDHAELHVRSGSVPPYFAIPPEPVYEILPGSNINLTCVAVGSPMPFVSWKNGDNDIENNEVMVGKNILRLETVHESGNYTCVAYSKLGKIESTTQVVLRLLPRSPTNVRVSDVTRSSVRLSWSYDMESENIIYYIIQYKPRNSSQDYSEITGITTKHYTIESLMPHTEYEFNVIARNSIGHRSQSVESVYSTTAEIKSPNAPQNIQELPLSQNTIMVRWDQSENIKEPIIAYNIFYTVNPKQPLTEWNMQRVDNSRLTIICDLYHQKIYTIQIEAITTFGLSPLSVPIKTKTQIGVPSQPLDLRTVNVFPTSIHLAWKKPRNPSEPIIGYEVYWNDSLNQLKYQRSIPDVESFILGELYPDTYYYVSVAAKSRIGEGAPTTEIGILTTKYVPEEPIILNVTALTTRTIRVHWEQPENNGLIFGYKIYINELTVTGNNINEELVYNIDNETAEEFNVTGLQPDTEYSVQVSAVTRNGYGTRSKAVDTKTLGGVPKRAALNVHLNSEDPPVVSVEWFFNGSNEDTLWYTLKYGRVNGSDKVEINVTEQNRILITGLEYATKYEIRFAGNNKIGMGQESIAYINTPEGLPKSEPQNITYRFQSPTTVLISWNSLLPHLGNGHISHYGTQLLKVDDNSIENNETNETQIILFSLFENCEYKFRVRAYTSKGQGPWSSQVTIITPADMPRFPLNVKASATSERSVEVWWDKVPQRDDILGYKVFFTETLHKDLDKWKIKMTLTSSVELTGLDAHTSYAIRVAPYTIKGLGHLSEALIVETKPIDVPLQLISNEVLADSITLSWKQPTNFNRVQYVITYAARKEFCVSQKVFQVIPFSKNTVYVNSNITQYKIDKLKPFTSYQVNVTAISEDDSFHPPAKIIVTTSMAVPNQVNKPDLLGSKNGQEFAVTLHQASEENGPIDHYYLIVIPASQIRKYPDDYKIEELITPLGSNGPYITAKFTRNMPFIFYVGNNKKYNGFLNRRLSVNETYKIFVRAVVHNPYTILYKSSPFSEELNLNMSFNSTNDAFTDCANIECDFD